MILQRAFPNRSGCTLCCPRRLIDCPRRSCRSSERGELFEREIHFPNHEMKWFRDEAAAVDQRLTKVAGRSAQKCPDSSPCSSWIMIHCTRCSWRANNRGKWFVREIQILNPWVLWFWEESSAVFLKRRYPLKSVCTRCSHRRMIVCLCCSCRTSKKREWFVRRDSESDSSSGVILKRICSGWRLT